MDSAELQNDSFTSETVGLLILNELRLMRRDLKAGLMRIESKVDSILDKKVTSPVEANASGLESNNDSAAFPYDAPNIYLDKSQLNNAVSGSSIDNLNTSEFASKELDISEENPVACTVHVDISELPDDISLDSYDGSEDQKPVLKRLGSRTTKKNLVIRNFENGAEKVFPVVETEDGRFQCTLCPQSFSNKGNLRRHYRYHLGDKRYQCQVCSKKFFRKDYLYSHVKTHSQYRKKEESGKYEINKDLNVEKLHSCSFCNRSFNVAANLKRHMRAHTGEKPFTCSHCDERFLRQDSLNKHIQKEHEENAVMDVQEKVD